MAPDPWPLIALSPCRTCNLGGGHGAFHGVFSLMVNKCRGGALLHPFSKIIMGIGGGKMPLYEFTCGNCGHNFTVLIPWKRKGETTCPQCGSDNLREVLAAFSSPGCGQDTGGFT